jgi:hypothetical protein
MRLKEAAGAFVPAVCDTWVRVTVRSSAISIAPESRLPASDYWKEIWTTFFSS